MEEKDYVNYELAKAIISETEHSLYDVQKRLREKHNIHIEIPHKYIENVFNSYYGIIYKLDESGPRIYTNEYKTYKEALIESLKQALKYI